MRVFVIRGSCRPNSSKIFLNFGMMITMMNDQDAHGDADDDRRVHHRPDDLLLQALGLFLELGQALEDDFQGTAGLAGFHHVHVQPVEALRVLGHRFGERHARFDVFDDVDQRCS